MPINISYLYKRAVLVLKFMNILIALDFKLYRSEINHQRESLMIPTSVGRVSHTLFFSIFATPEWYTQFTFVANFIVIIKKAAFIHNPNGFCVNTNCISRPYVRFQSVASVNTGNTKSGDCELWLCAHQSSSYIAFTEHIDDAIPYVPVPFETVHI